MAYGTLYTHSFYDRSGSYWEYEILKENYTGDATELIGGANPLVFSSDKSGDDWETPIMATMAVAQVVCTRNFEFHEMLTGKKWQYKLSVNKDSSLFWVGFLVPEEYGEPYVQPPYIVELRFIDGLAHLKNIYYENTSCSGLVMLSRMLHACLNQIPSELDLRESIDIYENSLDNDDSRNSGFTANYAYRRFFQGKSYYDILRTLLVTRYSYIVQAAGTWVVKRIRADENIIQRTWDYHSHAYLNPQPASYNQVVDTDKGDTERFAIHGNSLIFNPSIQHLITKSNYSLSKGVLPNPEFKYYNDKYEEEYTGPRQEEGEEIESLCGYEINTQMHKISNGEIKFILESNDPRTTQYIETTRIEQLKEGEQFTLEISYYFLTYLYNWYFNTTTYYQGPCNGYIMVKFVSGSTIYYLDEDNLSSENNERNGDGKWVTESKYYRFFDGDGNSSIDGSTRTTRIYIPGLPGDGYMIIRINSAYISTLASGNNNFFAKLYLKSIVINKNIVSLIPSSILKVTVDPDYSRVKEIDLDFVDIPDFENNYKHYDGTIFIGEGGDNASRTWDIKGENQQQSLALLVSELLAYQYSKPAAIISGKIHVNNFQFDKHVKEKQFGDRIFKLHRFTYSARYCEVEAELYEFAGTGSDEKILLRARPDGKMITIGGKVIRIK